MTRQCKLITATQTCNQCLTVFRLMRPILREGINNTVLFLIESTFMKNAFKLVFAAWNWDFSSKIFIHTWAVSRIYSNQSYCWWRFRRQASNLSCGDNLYKQPFAIVTHRLHVCRHGPSLSSGPGPNIIDLGLWVIECTTLHISLIPISHHSGRHQIYFLT